METFAYYASAASVIIGLASAAAWLRAGVVKVSHESAMKERGQKAAAKGERPNLASVTLDGWDMSATFAAQSKWNAIGAVAAAVSILLQQLAVLAK